MLINLNAHQTEMLKEQKALMASLAEMTGQTLEQAAPKLIAGLEDANHKLVAPWAAMPWHIADRNPRHYEAAERVEVNKHVIAWLRSLGGES